MTHRDRAGGLGHLRPPEPETVMLVPSAGPRSTHSPLDLGARPREAAHVAISGPGGPSTYGVGNAPRPVRGARRNGRRGRAIEDCADHSRALAIDRMKSLSIVLGVSPRRLSLANSRLAMAMPNSALGSRPGGRFR